MGEPVKIITFGGAKFDSNQVASQSTVKKNGTTYYVVNFKTGAKIQYPAQEDKNNAAIDIGRGESSTYVGYYDDNLKNSIIYDNMGKPGYENFTGGEGALYQVADKYTISRFWGAEFTGTAKPDDVDLKGCTRCTVNISGGNSYARDKVSMEEDEKFVSQKNEVIMDAKDEVYTQYDKIEGAGTYHEGDSRDKLK